MQVVNSSQEVGTELCPIRIEVCFHQGQGDLPYLCQCIYALCRRDPFASKALLGCSSLPLLSSLPECGRILSSAPFIPNFPSAPNPIAELFAFKFAVLSGPWGGGAWVELWAAVQGVGAEVPSFSLPRGLVARCLRGRVQGELGLLSRNWADKQPSLLSGHLGKLWLWRGFASFCWA